MKNVKIVLSLVVLFWVLTSSAYAKGKIICPFVDKTVAGVKIGVDDFRKLLSLYGQGLLYVAPEGDSKTLCYYFKNSDTYLLAFSEGGKDSYISKISILKGDSGPDYRYNVYDRCKESALKVTLRTGNGVYLGMSPQELKKIYGKSAKESGFENRLDLEYHTNFEEDPDIDIAYDADYRFLNNKLVEFYVYEGE